MSSRLTLGISFLGSFALAGCGSPHAKSGSGTTAELVSMDPSRNGAASADAESAAGIPLGSQKLNFIVQATGQRPIAGDDQEQRLAMSQAAVVEALGTAVAQARRQQGQTFDQFSAPIGRGTTLTYRLQADGGRDVEIKAELDGRSVRLHSSDGHLNHPPYAPGTVERVIKSTNGRFALLSCEPSLIGEEATATIACYQAAGQAGYTTASLSESARN